MLPDVYFGKLTPVDWRKSQAESDPDDEELDITPSDVVQLLGFDPKEFSEDSKRTTDGWVTLKSDNDRGEEGYRRVLIGPGGKVQGGDLPKEVQGKTLGEGMQELSEESKSPDFSEKEDSGFDPKEDYLKKEEKPKEESTSTPKEEQELPVQPDPKLKNEKRAGHYVPDVPIEFLQKEGGFLYDEAKDIVMSVEYWSDGGYDAIRSNKLQKDSENLEKMIFAMPKYNGKVFRGVRLDKSLLKDFSPGSVIDMRGLSSWSSNPEKAVNFSGSGISKISVVFQLEHVKNGCSIRYMSNWPSEDEVLMSGKSKFMIESVEKKKIGDKPILDTPRYRYFINVTEIE